MTRPIRLVLAGLGLIAGTALSASAHENDVEITRTASQVCITSNGTPTHDIGRFPNSGNPNSFRAQTVRVCVPAEPRLTGRVTRRTSASGITLSGILIRPGTADFYDPRSPRGFSRNPASGWRLEGMGAAQALGMDAANAHVDHRGLYHYHAVSAGLLEAAQGTVIGYAPDGFEIHYIGANARSSWQLKPGTRVTAPGGRHDGTYEEDWVHVAGSGNLDECNGATVNGRYVYFATDTFPFFPRCFRGEVSRDFLGRP